MRGGLEEVLSTKMTGKKFREVHFSRDSALLRVSQKNGHMGTKFSQNLAADSARRNRRLIAGDDAHSNDFPFPARRCGSDRRALCTDARRKAGIFHIRPREYGSRSGKNRGAYLEIRIGSIGSKSHLACGFQQAVFILLINHPVPPL